jgi:hypothetical protein
MKIIDEINAELQAAADRDRERGWPLGKLPKRRTSFWGYSSFA